MVSSRYYYGRQSDEECLEPVEMKVLSEHSISRNVIGLGIIEWKDEEHVVTWHDDGADYICDLNELVSQLKELGYT